jgi:protoheme ferro-lyase
MASAEISTKAQKHCKQHIIFSSLHSAPYKAHKKSPPYMQMILCPFEDSSI